MVVGMVVALFGIALLVFVVAGFQGAREMPILLGFASVCVICVICVICATVLVAIHG